MSVLHLARTERATRVAEARQLENPGVPLTSAALVDAFAGPRTHSGVYVSEASAHRVVAVYRAWSLLAGTMGSLPLETLQGPEGEQKPWLGPAAMLLAYPGGRDAVSGIPDPGAPPGMSVWETAFTHQLGWGNAYLLKVANVARTGIVRLDPLRPDRVRVKAVRRTSANPAGKQFDVLDDSGRVEELTPRDVLHIPALATDGLCGISPIGAARQALGLAVAAEEYGARFFGSGSMVGGILTNPNKLTQESAAALKARWNAKVQGLGHAHEIAVLDADTKWQQVGIPPGDAQFIESRKFQVTEIARLYGIPPHLLGDVEKTTSWGTGIEQQGLHFLQFTLRPWLTRMEQALSNELLPRGVNARFRVEELLRGDVQARFNAYQTGIQTGVLTPNEARKREGLPPQPGGDQLLFPANFAALQTVVNPPEPEPAPDLEPFPTPAGASTNGNGTA